MMGKTKLQFPIAASGTSCGVLWETYRYPQGGTGEDPCHVHETHQICLSLNFPGQYRYRGAAIAVPSRSVSIIHPGEPHSSRDLYPRDRDTEFQLFYIPNYLWHDREEKTVPAEPFFRDAVTTHPLLFAQLLRLHKILRQAAEPLQAESLLHESLQFLRRFSQAPPDPNRLKAAPNAVQRIREYLSDHAVEKVGLQELAQVAGLSEYHLLRVFRQQVGLPPHAYQVQLRLDRARHLLVSGRRIGEVAVLVGFADQSHFTRTFRRVIGCTPQQYLRSR